MMLRWNFRTIAKNWIAFKPVNVLKSYLTYLNGVSKTTYLNGVSQTIKNEAKEQKRRFRTMLLGTLSASLLGKGKGAIATSQGLEANMPERGAIRADEDTVRAGQNF